MPLYALPLCLLPLCFVLFAADFSPRHYYYADAFYERHGAALMLADYMLSP